MEEETDEEELKTEEEQKESAETVEEAAVEEKAEEVSEKVEEVAEEAVAAEGEEEKPATIEEEKPAPTEEEEAKPPSRKEKPEEEEIVEERIYTIPLGRAWIMPPKKRAPRAMRIIRGFLMKHMKLEVHGKTEEEEEAPKKLVISNEVNERVWGRGIEKPSRKIRVRAAKDKEGNVTVYLAEGD